MRLEHSIQGDWRELPHRRCDAIRAWLVRNGFGPDEYSIIGVRIVNEGAVELHCYDRGADGKPYIDDAGELPTFRTVVAIAEPPPPEWWDDREAAA